jgi:concanavalin A-like lectin/glucanase superfamily protein
MNIMNDSNLIDWRSGLGMRPSRATSPLTRFILPALAALALLQTSIARAALPVVFSDEKISFTSVIPIDRSTAPEPVLFSGQFEVVSSVLPPGIICTPNAPGPAIAGIAVFTPGISGIGLTSGLKYQLIGATAVKRIVTLPGSTVVPMQLVLIMPRLIRPIWVPILTIPVQAIITFDENGKILQATVPPINLAAHWQAEGTAADASGVNSGVLSSTETVGFVPGKIGQGFHFANQGFVEVPSSPSLEPAKLTASAWVRGTSPGLFGHILVKGASACDGGSYALYTGASGGLQFYVSNGTTFGSSPDAGAALWDGNWHFVAGTFDGAIVRLYVDGIQVGTGTPAPIVINYNLPNNDKFYIGAYRGSCELRFNGDVDEVQIFGRALSAAEVQGLYDASK